MSLPSRTRILPDQVPLGTDELDAFSQAFRGAAEEQGLTVRQACRYEAWVLAFLSWCREKPSRRPVPDQMAAFQSALRDGATVEEAAVCEAMDALSFLFGTARAARSYLVADGEGEDRDARDPLPEKDILSLQARWRNGGDHTDDAARATASSRAGDETEDTSTAELCIEQFQSQLDTLHSAETESA